MQASIRFITLLALLILLFSCKKKEEITGKTFIPRETFVEILVDIHLMDGITNDHKFYHHYDSDSLDILSPILKKYGVSKHIFDTTMHEYSRYPRLMDEVFNDVLTELNIMLDENHNSEGPNRAIE